MEDAHYETVQASGYWYPEKQPGDRFPQGELLGRVERTLQAITAPLTAWYCTKPISWV